MKKTAFHLNLTSMRGAEFPPNLITTTNSNFAVQFMIAINKEALEKISELCKMVDGPVEIWFSYQESPKASAYRISESAKFCDFADMPFTIGKSIGQYLQYADSPPIFYISVTFENDKI